MPELSRGFALTHKPGSIGFTEGPGLQRIKTPETGTKRPLWASSITCAGVSSVRIATGHLGARARAQRRRHSPFAVHHRNHPGIFAPTTPSHGLSLTESPSSLPCGFLSHSSWRPASKSAFLLRLPHLYRSSLCVSESLPRPHHSPSLGPSPFSKRLVLCRATAALPTQHNTTDAPSVTAQQQNPELGR